MLVISNSHPHSMLLFLLVIRMSDGILLNISKLVSGIRCLMGLINLEIAAGAIILLIAI